jgi:radical SAM protein with 4Fe4S-binding SPASM domain
MMGVRPTTACPEADYAAASAPTTLWIELTSRCPFACVFCSRHARRGKGEDMDFGLFEELIGALEHPECIRLNYSGESMHYPRLADAIRLARQTGAFVELVTSLASADEETLRAVVRSGLDRLGISLHTVSPVEWAGIYGSGSLDRMFSRLDRLLAVREECGNGRPALEIAFVAMEANLREFPAVVSVARRKGIKLVTVLPVIPRDLAPTAFAAERDERGLLRGEFRAALRETVAKARAAFPSVEIRGGPEIECTGTPFPGAVAAGTRIRTCDQDPWTTVHILSNGDVVPCEVQDKLVLGNLRDKSLRAIWQGEAYREFRRGFVSGLNRACLSCEWKVVGLTSAPMHKLSGTDWGNAQFLRGWHPRDGAGTLWSKREGVLLLPRGGGLVLRGALPPSGDGRPNGLEINCDGVPAGRVVNPTGSLLRFSTCAEVTEGSGPMVVSLRVDDTYCPARTGVGGDVRELGFALFGIEVLR